MFKLRLTVSSKDLFYGVSLFIIIGSVILRIERFVVMNMLLAMVSMLIVIIVTVKNLRTLKVLQPFLLIEIGIYLYIIINTLRFHYIDSLFPILMMFIKGIAVAAVFAAYKNNKVTVCKMLCDVFLVLIILNLIQMLFFPDLIGYNGGMRSYLISSNYNQFGGIFMPGILMSYITASIEKHNAWRFVLITLLSILSVAIVGSVTSTLCFLLLVVFFLIRKKMILVKIATLGLIMFIVMFFYTFVVSSYDSVLNNSTLVDNFMDYTGKSMTFSGRTNVWFKSLFIISSHPVLGIGAYAGGSYANHYLGVSNVHNVFLELFMLGGAVLFCVVSISVILLFYQLHKKIDKVYFYGELFIFMVFILMMQLEVYNYFMIFLFFLSLYFSIGISTIRKKHENINNIKRIPICSRSSVR